MRFRDSLFILALAIQPAWTQTFTGTISGVVDDPNSARIPHATVHALNEANGEVRQVTTGNDGLYVFSQLPPGTYELSAEVQGFRTSRCSSAPSARWWKFRAASRCSTRNRRIAR